MSNLPLKDGLAEFCKKFYVLCLDFEIYPFVKFCGLGITPGLSFFWRPPVVVEQNYPRVHPVMIPGCSLEVYPVRVAIFRKNLKDFEAFQNYQMREQLAVLTLGLLRFTQPK